MRAILLTTIFYLGCVRCVLPPGLLEFFYHQFSAVPDDLVKDRLPSLEYDFVIVGAGSGGSVLANRLTENPKWQVLLLEAGKDEMFLTDIPLMATVLHITDYNWGFRTEPGRPRADGTGGYCLSMVDGRCKWARGKAVGGTSVINFMIYSRGSPADYDLWETQGNPGWSYREILPYFKKSENSRLVHEDFRYHGHGGYLDVTTSPYISPLREFFLKAGKELGYDVIDYDGEKLIGVSTAHVNLRNGHRVSANKAFLRPIRGRRNFHLSKLSQVTRIIIDPRTRKATGVEFVKNNQKYVVKAKKEVLLSAGSINSPQLLMLAGIGPKDHLQSLGIRVLEDLQVGMNLQDHVSMQGLTFLVNESVTIVEPRLILNPANTINYLVQGSGPLSSPAGAEVIAFINTKNDKPKPASRNAPKTFPKSFKVDGGNVNLLPKSESKPQERITRNVSSITVDSINSFGNFKRKSSARLPEDYPDIELVFGVSALTGDLSGGYRALIGLTDEFYDKMYNGYKGRDAFSVVPVLLRPKSRGRVSLKSRNPFDPPILQANYYDHEEDLDTMVRGIRKAIEFGSTEALKRYNATLLSTIFPGCEDHRAGSDDYWRCASRHVSSTLSHFAGTCKMGRREDGAVVDHRLRVHGINGLRVVDASVMPTIIAGHTNAAVYMIAEKAADMIKEDWET